MLFPVQELWTGNNFAGLVECFNEEQLTDERSFEEKLKTQLDGAPSQQVRLIADLIAVHYLFVTSVGGRRKRELVHQILSYTGDTYPHGSDIDRAFATGIGSGGQGFNAARPKLLTYLISFGQRLKQQSKEDREALLGDPEKLKAWLVGPAGTADGGEQMMRHILLHLLFPEAYERISANDDKYLIRNGRVLRDAPQSRGLRAREQGSAFGCGSSYGTNVRELARRPRHDAARGPRALQQRPTRPASSTGDALTTRNLTPLSRHAHHTADHTRGISSRLVAVRYPFHSLEDFLIANDLSVDGQLDDGWGATFPVKGREIDATVLFADISSFSARSLNLSAVETLAFVNNFFAWITAEALRGRPGIIDKYIGDEVMAVFSTEFGSDDPFRDAVEAARAMGEHDALDFSPHIGIASGRVVVGYVGTPLKFNCSVFGAPVALAARCAGVKPDQDDSQIYTTTITFPDAEWQGRDFADVFPPRRWHDPDGAITEQPHPWDLLDARRVEMKNLPPVEVRQIVNRSFRIIQGWSAETRIQEGVEHLRRTGRYWPHDAATRDE